MTVLDALRARLVARARQRPTDERGSAVVEFVFLGVLLLVPLLYLVLVLARVQAGSYAVSAAAREAGRAFVTADTDGAAGPRARAAARIAFLDQGFGEAADVTVTCSASPCLTPGARVETRAAVRVPLPLVPAFARDVVPLEVPVEASHVSTVDRFRAAP